MIVSCAVPFFFVSSGFLIAEKTDGMVKAKEQEYIKQTIIKYVKMYVVWNLIYLPITIWGFVKELKSGTSLIKIAILWARGFFVIGEQFCSWPLWYLLSLIFGVVIVKILLKKIGRESHYVVVFACCFFALAYILNMVRDYPNPDGLLSIVQKIVIYTIGSGRIFTGAAFILAGIWAQYHLAWITECFHVGAILISLCIALSLLIRTPYSTTYPLSLIVAPTIVKMACRKTRLSDWIQKSGMYMRQFSQDAYFTHMYFIFLFTYNLVCFEKIDYQPVRVFTLTMICVIGFNIIHYVLKRNGRKSMAR